MPDELLAVLVARRLLSHSAGGFISEAFRGFSRKVLNAVAALGIDEARIDQSFSASWHGFSPAPDKIFKTVAEALIQRRMIEIGYHSPGSGASTRRIVEPHHLQHYMASWSLSPTAACARTGANFTSPALTVLNP